MDQALKPCGKSSASSLSTPGTVCSLRGVAGGGEKTSEKDRKRERKREGGGADDDCKSSCEAMLSVDPGEGGATEGQVRGQGEEDKEVRNTREEGRGRKEGRKPSPSEGRKSDSSKE